MRRLRVKFRGYSLTADAGAFAVSGQVANLLLGGVPVNTAAPSVSGTLQVGSTLTATTGTWSGTVTSYAYQWRRGGAPISGATSSTYLLQPGDAGFTISVAVTASNTSGSATAVSSGAGPISAAADTVQLTTLQITSATSGSNLPWAFGHAFKQGDVPSTLGVVGSSPDFQAIVTSRWPEDGSVKHAIIAGRSNFASPGTVTVTISRGPQSSGTALTTADLKTAMPASTSIAVGGTTMTLSGTFLDSPQRTVCAGPVMSNWIYRLPVAGNSHLVIWADVRLFKGGAVEILPWVENAYLTVASPQQFAATACAVTVGGTSRFSQSIDINHHTRVLLISGRVDGHWYPVDPQITPKHDTTYLRSTKLVPNYGWTSPSAATLDALTQTYTPNTWAGVPLMTSSGGDSAAILGFTQSSPDALYVATGDARAYKAALTMSFAGGTWDVHHRADASATAPNEPFRFSEYPRASYQTPDSPILPTYSGPSSNWGATGSRTSHQMSRGFLAWLISGRWWHLDEAVFWVGNNYLWQSTSARSNAQGLLLSTAGANTDRGAAWALRQLAQTLSTMPTTYPGYADYVASWEANTQWWYDQVKPGGAWANNLGVLPHYGAQFQWAYGYYTGYADIAGWMQMMLVLVWGYTSDIGLPQSAASLTRHVAVRDHGYKLPVGMSGDGAAGNWNYRWFGPYSLPIGPINTGPWFTDFGQVLTVAKNPSSGAVTVPTDNRLYRPSTTTPWPANDATYMTSYFGQHATALAYAVDHGATGAVAAWLRVTGANDGSSHGSWNAVTTQFNDLPQYGIVPRVSVGLPSWLTSVNTFQWVSVPNSTLATFDATVPISAAYGPREGKVTNWCGGALKRSGSVYILGAAGGHNDYAGNEVNALTLNSNTPGWTQLRAPSAVSDIINAVPAYADGRRAATHTYYCNQFDQTGNRLFVMPAPGMGAPGRFPEAPVGYAYTDNNVPMAFSLATNDWQSFATFARWPGSAGGDFTACLVVTNAATGDIYYARNGDAYLWRFTPSTNTWTQLGAIYHQNYAGSAIDHTRGRMLVVGDYSGTLIPRVFSLAGVEQSVTFGGLGDSVLRMSGYPGVVYDEVRDSFLVFKNTNPITVYEVNASTWAVSQPSMTGTIPASRFNGIQNSVQYVPELKGVVLHNDYNGPVKFMRTA